MQKVVTLGCSLEDDHYGRVRQKEILVRAHKLDIEKQPFRRLIHPRSMVVEHCPEVGQVPALFHVR